MRTAEARFGSQANMSSRLVQALVNVGLIAVTCPNDQSLATDELPGDDRDSSCPIETLQAILGGTLHGVEYNYAMGDLLRIVAAQADNTPG